MNPADRPQDSYRYGPDDMAALADRFTFEPVAPSAIQERIDEGNVLYTTDIPDYLEKPIATNADTSIALYRLVQLFGTPNVPGLEAGAPQPMREATTWQYLFRVEYDPEAGEGDGQAPMADAAGEHLVSVYDNRTNLSAGIAEWYRPEGDRSRWALEPSPDPLPSGSMPDEEFLRSVVQLVLSTVEHAVEATHEGLHV